MSSHDASAAGAAGSDLGRKGADADPFAVDFLRRFAVPLVSGGILHIGAPLGRSGAGRLLRAARQGLSVSEPALALSRARGRIVDEILIGREAPTLEEDAETLPLLAAVHDVLFLLHPAVHGIWSSQRRTRELAEHAIQVCHRAGPLQGSSRPEGGRRDLDWIVVQRHSLLHGLFLITREDSFVSYWAGRREFIGAAPPRRLLAWPHLRRVVEERRKSLVYPHLLALPEGIGRAAVRALLDASPLTDLLGMGRLDPVREVRGLAPLLRSRQICRYVVSRYLEAGVADCARPLSGAYLRLLGETPASSAGVQSEDHANPAELHGLLQFFCHLHLCTLLRGKRDEVPVEKLIPPGDGDRDGGALDYYGLYGALAQGWPELARPADLALDHELVERAERYAQACRRACGPARTAELSLLCAHALKVPPTLLTEPEPRLD